MLEILFLLYLISGALKGILMAYGVGSPIDLTLFTGAAVFLYGAGSELRKGGWENFRRKMDEGKVLLLLLAGFTVWCGISTFFLSPSENYASWKFFVFFTNILAFSIPLISRSFNYERFARYFCAFVFLYGTYTFFAYGLRHEGMLGVIGMEDPELLERLYMRAGLLLGVSGFLGFLMGWKLGLLNLNLVVYLLFGSAARGPILFFTVLLIIGGILVCIKKRERIGAFLRNAWTSRSWRKFGFGVLVANFLVLGCIFSSDLLQAPYERTYSRYAILTGYQQEGVKGSLSEDSSSGNDGKKEVASNNTQKRLKQYEFVFTNVTRDKYHFIIGYGYGSFKLFMYGEEGRAYPHNLLLEIWFELGVLGVVLALLFLFYVIRKGLLNRNYLILIAIFFFMMNAMKSYSLVDVRLLFALMGMAVFVPFRSVPRGDHRGRSLKKGTS